MPPAPTKSAPTAKETAILAVLHGFAAAYQGRDIDGMMAHFAPDPTLVFFGTGADEKRVGVDEIRAQIQRDFDQSERISITWGWYAITIAGRLAWVAAEAVVNAHVEGHDLSVPLRATFVCEERKRKWLVVQGHLSAPIPSQEAGHSFPT